MPFIDDIYANELITNKLNKITIPVYPNINLKTDKITFKDYTKKDEPNDDNTQDNIKTTQIIIPNHNNINKFIDSLNNYLDDIFSVSKDATIYKIELTYTKLEHSYKDYYKLVIYSNKDLNTTYLNNKIMSGNSSYQIIKLNAQNESDIVNNFTQLLQNEQTCPDGCVSVSRLLYEHSNYRKIINEVKNNLSYKLEQKILKTNFYKQKYPNKNYTVQIDFYNDNTMYIRLGRYNDDKIELKYTSDNIIIPINKLDSSTLYFLREIKEQVAEYFIFSIENSVGTDYFGYQYTIPIVNADYVIELEKQKITNNFYKSNGAFNYYDDKKLLLSIETAKNDLNKFKYSADNNELTQLLLLNYDLTSLYDKSFVKIDDCPKFLRNQLSRELTNLDKRKNELSNNVISLFKDSDSKSTKKIKSLIINKIYKK